MVTAAGRQIGRWTNRQTDGLAGGQIDRGIGQDIKGYKDSWTNIKNRQINRQNTQIG
jgi:hypothetical protein